MADYTWLSPDWYNCGTIPDQIVGWEVYSLRGNGFILRFVTTSSR